MDIAMVLGGAVIAMLQGMDPDGRQRSIDSLHMLANRTSCTPAERHIFQVIATAIDGEPTRQPFEVIQGGAA
jgi:hypothetical protein